MKYPSLNGFWSGRDKIPKQNPYPIAPAATKYGPHSAGTQKMGGERGIKQGFLAVEVMEPVLKFQEESQKCGIAKSAFSRGHSIGQSL